MFHCSRCAATSKPIPESGFLYIAPPMAHTAGQIRALCRAEGLEYSEPAANVLAVALAPGLLGRLAGKLGGGLSRSELRDTRSVVVGEGAALGPADLGTMQPLSVLVAQVQGSWFEDMLRESRL